MCLDDRSFKNSNSTNGLLHLEPLRWRVLRLLLLLFVNFLSQSIHLTRNRLVELVRHTAHQRGDVDVVSAPNHVRVPATVPPREEVGAYKTPFTRRDRSNSKTTTW